MIKPLQARGDFGERHIHKLPLSFPIPKFDPNLRSHRELAVDGLSCYNKVDRIKSFLSLKSIGKIRAVMRKELAPEFERIEKNVSLLLSQKGTGLKTL